MNIDRIRTVTYEASVIFLAGVLIAVPVIFMLRYLERPTIADFKREYFISTDVLQRRDVASKYLALFPAEELIQAVEDESAGLGCHLQGHGIGRAIYKANPNFGDAIRTCGGACTHGCFHGAMMEMFQTDSDTLGGALTGDSASDTIEQIKEIAPDLCSRPEVASVVKMRYCTHGIGHAFAYMAGDDLDRAVAACGVLKEKHAINPCVSGAFMETFLSTTSAEQMQKMTIAPCDRFPGTEHLCYRYRVYGWIAGNGAQAALKACEPLGKFEAVCIRSIAMAAATTEMMQTPKGLDQLCGALEGNKRIECIAGSFLRIIDSNNGDDSERLCDVVDPTYRDGCLKTLKLFLDAIVS